MISMRLRRGRIVVSPPGPDMLRLTSNAMIAGVRAAAFD
jgi:threonine/homoserine/homoserine lactone efflux protein